MSAQAAEKITHQIKAPHDLSPRIRGLRDYYFKGTQRAWNNAFTSWTTGTPWDVQFNEMTYYIVPETYMLMQTLRSSYRQAARPVATRTLRCSAQCATRTSGSSRGAGRCR